MSRSDLYARCRELGFSPAGSQSVEELQRMIEMGERDPGDLTRDEMDAVLEYVREHRDASLKQVADATGVWRRHIRIRLKQDVEFRGDYEDARGRGAEQVWKTLDKLAVEGVEEPIVSAGKLVRDDDGNILYKRVYSEKLIEFRARMLLDEAQKLNPAARLGIEVTGADGGAIKVQAGVPFADVAAVLVAAGKLPPPSLGQDEVAGELVAETDEPA